MKIYIVEDDADIRRMESYALVNSGFDVLEFSEGSGFFAELERSLPDLVLLDIMLPGEDGLEILQKLRSMKKTEDIPIMIITAKGSEIDRVRGLDMGADDYITKPFGVPELLARIRTSLRHSNKLNNDSELYTKPYHAKDLTIDFLKRKITLKEEEIHLTPIEYKIVAYLAQNSGMVMTYSTIMNNVWGPYAESDNKILRVNMANIRRKLEANPVEPVYIFTEVGVGYRMLEDESM